MKNVFIILLLTNFTTCGFTQTQKAVGHFDIVTAKVDYEKEVKFYYEQNWLLFRKQALIQKAISAYKLMYTEPDSTNTFSIILYTEFENQAAFDKVEEAFTPIMKWLRPDGPKMLNRITRNEFILNRSSYDVEIQ